MRMNTLTVRQTQYLKEEIIRMKHMDYLDNDSDQEDQHALRPNGDISKALKKHKNQAANTVSVPRKLNLFGKEIEALENKLFKDIRKPGENSDSDQDDIDQVELMFPDDQVGGKRKSRKSQFDSNKYPAVSPAKRVETSPKQKEESPT
jgi:hypothetical protein